MRIKQYGTSSGAVLSNKKIGWGIKRNDNHEQPDLGSNNKKLIDENEDIAMGNKEDKFVYLTFDEGYEAGYTPQILDVLKENDVKAAFFITGHYLNTKPELVKRMIDEGHIVGNHTVNHPSMPDLDNDKVKEEIMKLHVTVFEKFGYEMKYLRPPKGEFSQRTLYLSKSLGYTTVMWSFAYDDWDENKQGRENYAKEKILSNTHNGAVILLHANSKDNTNILDETIKEIKKQGYEFKTLDEFKR
jgi:peptidoglycan-N-acetylmuramic acid deacetylase